MIEVRCVIVGAGFAGAATAYHLARRGVGEILLFEREGAGGMHSSGRNAAMVRQVVEDPWIGQLVREGARAIGSLRSDEGRLYFHANGSLLIASGEGASKLQREAALARDAGLQIERLTKAGAIGHVPVLERADFEEGCFCSSDGVVDIALLLDHYLRGAREAGARIIFNAEVKDIIVENGKVQGIHAGDHLVHTPAVVNAAGAWAAPLAARAGASAVPLKCLRRHLMFTGPFPKASRKWPFVWDVSHEVYFRPEADGLLLSPCDEGECAPCLPQTDPAVIGLLHEKLARHVPELEEITIAKTWAGLRVFADDRRFVIGPDPELQGFFWVAGLGGHGVTASDSIGAMAANLVERPDRDAGSPFSPSRFRVVPPA